MNGGHDLGGLQTLGAITPEPETLEPVFHADWEKRVFALTLAAGALGKWNLDMSRHARERQLPADYIDNTYYENWLCGLLTLLEESGALSHGELESGRSNGLAEDVRVLTAQAVADALRKGGPADRSVREAPRFAVGDHIRVKNEHPSGHTRAPRYVRNRRGIISTHHGSHVFADESAHGVDAGQHLYSVVFSARELWGQQASGKDSVYVDLWEPHLRSANRSENQ